MKKVVITGSSNGIGYALAYKLFSENNMPKLEIHGIDVEPRPTVEGANGNMFYTHTADVGNKAELPKIDNVDILINNAGIQSQSELDIVTNLFGVMHCTEKYALSNLKIKSVVNLASVSAHNGAEFPEYVASKGGVLSYTKWCAKELAKNRAICNSISFGGVLTDLNQHIFDDSELWQDVMNETPLRKWCSAAEAADWIWFVAYTNKSMTGQDIIVDNGEMYNHKFVW